MTTKTKEIFDVKKHACRPFDDMKELVRCLAKNRIVWCWGANSWANVDNKALRFKVQGYLHKGFVFLTVNGLDLFDIYLTNVKGEIKQVETDVYIEDLIERIDLLVETKR
jgi:hypothetical protein